VSDNFVFNFLTVHTHKDMFNSLFAKEEGTIKMVDDSACEVIGIGSINITRKDETMRALEAIRYVPEVRYNLISIKVLDEEGCRSKYKKASSRSLKCNFGRREG